MKYFSNDSDRDNNIGELVLETLLSINISSITDLDFAYNSSWVMHPLTTEERSGNVELLAEFLSK